MTELESLNSELATIRNQMALYENRFDVGAMLNIAFLRHQAELLERQIERIKFREWRKFK